MTHPTLLLALHGTRDPHGTAVAHHLTHDLTRLTGRPARLAFVDVGTPTIDQATTTPGPLVLVPAFLASGYHVRTDIPRQLARAGRTDTAITPALGEHPATLEVAARRLDQAGYQPGDALVLACAGTRDPHARAQLRRAAHDLSRRMKTPVALGFIATGRPTVAERVRQLRRRGHRRVAVASWLLAPGLFHDRLAASGADVLTRPLCPDTTIARAVVDLYRQAAAPPPYRAETPAAPRSSANTR